MLNPFIVLLFLGRPSVRTPSAKIGKVVKEKGPIADMDIEGIKNDRDIFIDNIKSKVEPDLNKIGLKLINIEELKLSNY